MTTWLHEERLAAVLAAVRMRAPRSVLDLGCGDGALLTRLAEEPGIERLVGLDAARDALERLRGRLAGRPEGARPSIRLVHGSISEAGKALTGFDCAVLVEVIEHVPPERLGEVERAVFGRMRPRAVVLTTPNAEFNALLGVPPHRFRHPEHRFEWSRARFALWARGVAERHRYRVALSPVAGHHPTLGGASQMAVFDADGP